MSPTPGVKCHRKIIILPRFVRVMSCDKRHQNPIPHVLPVHIHVSLVFSVVNMSSIKETEASADDQTTVNLTSLN